MTLKSNNILVFGTQNQLCQNCSSEIQVLDSESSIGKLTLGISSINDKFYETDINSWLDPSGGLETDQLSAQTLNLVNHDVDSDSTMTLHNEDRFQIRLDIPYLHKSLHEIETYQINKNLSNDWQFVFGKALPLEPHLSLTVNANNEQATQKVEFQNSSLYLSADEITEKIDERLNWFEVTDLLEAEQDDTAFINLEDWDCLEDNLPTFEETERILTSAITLNWDAGLNRMGIGSKDIFEPGYLSLNRDQEIDAKTAFAWSDHSKLYLDDSSELLDNNKFLSTSYTPYTSVTTPTIQTIADNFTSENKSDEAVEYRLNQKLTVIQNDLNEIKENRVWNRSIIDLIENVELKLDNIDAQGKISLFWILHPKIDENQLFKILKSNISFTKNDKYREALLDVVGEADMIKNEIKEVQKKLPRFGRAKLKVLEYWTFIKTADQTISGIEKFRSIFTNFKSMKG